MSGMVAIVILIGIGIALFWYGNAISRVFRPVGKMLDSADAHATVFSAEVKNNAIRKAAVIKINLEEVEIARSNLAIIDSFDLSPAISKTLAEDEPIVESTPKAKSTSKVKSTSKEPKQDK